MKVFLFVFKICTCDTDGNVFLLYNHVDDNPFAQMQKTTRFLGSKKKRLFKSFEIHLSLAIENSDMVDNCQVRPCPRNNLSIILALENNVIYWMRNRPATEIKGVSTTYGSL